MPKTDAEPFHVVTVLHLTKLTVNVVGPGGGNSSYWIRNTLTLKTGSVIRECATEAPISAHRSKSKFGPPLVLPKRWGGQLIRNPRTRKPDQKAKHEQQLFHDQYPALVVLDNFFYH